MSLMDEIRKIPPVTRTLCTSLVGVTLPCLLGLMSPHRIIFVKELITYRWEVRGEPYWLERRPQRSHSFTGMARIYNFLLWRYVVLNARFRTTSYSYGRRGSCLHLQSGYALVRLPRHRHQIHRYRPHKHFAAVVGQHDSTQHQCRTQIPGITKL